MTGSDFIGYVVRQLLQCVMPSNKYFGLHEKSQNGNLVGHELPHLVRTTTQFSFFIQLFDL